MKRFRQKQNEGEKRGTGGKKIEEKEKIKRNEEKSKRK